MQVRRRRDSTVESKNNIYEREQKGKEKEERVAKRGYGREWVKGHSIKKCMNPLEEKRKEENGDSGKPKRQWRRGRQRANGRSE